MLSSVEDSGYVQYKLLKIKVTSCVNLRVGSVLLDGAYFSVRTRGVMNEWCVYVRTVLSMNDCVMATLDDNLTTIVESCNQQHPSPS
jgi:hypothetical protein